MKIKEVKKCVKCGKPITNGVNGCAMMDECFDCHGGYPDYSRNKSNYRYDSGEESLYWEGRILARQEDFNF